jgi:ribonuclease HI
MKVIIYTDGGADPNPGIGGWAAVLRYGDSEKVLSGSDPATTNNRMELQAAISALEALTRPSQIEFHTDSEYLRRGISEWIGRWQAQGWRHKGGKPIPNLDLWQQLAALVSQHDINWHWVKGHAGDPLNERVDALARQARLAITAGAYLDEETPRLYVRASCRGNPGPGGWGVIIEEGEQSRQSSGGEVRTTNNRMELTGAIEALRLLPEGSALQLFTTSDYLFQGATRWRHGWRRRNWQKKDGRPVSNADLWQQLDRLLESRRVHWVNAKGEERSGDTRVQQALVEAAALATAAARTEA